MKKFIFSLLFVPLFLACWFAESFAADWLFTYPGGRLKAVTFSYDDGVIEDRELVKIFNSYNIKATFNVSLGRAVKRPAVFIQPQEMKELYKNHEIASHGFMHKTMTKQSDKALEAEIADNQKAIAELMGSAPPGFAYPYGCYTTQESPDRIFKALKRHNLRYARICKRKKDFDLPLNWLAWTPNGHHKMGNSVCKRYLKFKPQKMSVCYIWGHSYEFVRPAPCWEIIENICKTIANKPDIWYATNWEIARYVQACEAAEKASKYPEIVNPTDVTLHLRIDGKQITLAPKSKINLK